MKLYLLGFWNLFWYVSYWIVVLRFKFTVASLYIKYISKYKCKFMLLSIMNWKRFYLCVCLCMCVVGWVNKFVCKVYTPIKMANTHTHTHTHKKWSLCLTNFCMPQNFRPLKRNGTKKYGNLNRWLKNDKNQKISFK